MRKLTASLLLLISSPICADVAWQPVQTGLEVTQLTAPNDTKVVAFRIDPKQYQFSIKLANQSAFVSTLGKEANALVAINGGYFSKEMKPLGLRVSNGKVLSRAKPISWWGVFYLKNKVPHLSRTSDFYLDRKIKFALQAGPRLVMNDNILNLKPGVAERSAIGITNDQHIVLAITQTSSISLTDWARILKNQLKCPNALNLDGGSSSQLYSIAGYNISNYKPVTDAIIVRAAG